MFKGLVSLYRGIPQDLAVARLFLPCAYIIFVLY